MANRTCRKNVKRAALQGKLQMFVVGNTKAGFSLSAGSTVVKSGFARQCDAMQWSVDHLHQTAKKLVVAKRAPAVEQTSAVA